MLVSGAAANKVSFNPGVVCVSTEHAFEFVAEPYYSS